MLFGIEQEAASEIRLFLQTVFNALARPVMVKDCIWKLGISNVHAPHRGTTREKMMKASGKEATSTNWILSLFKRPRTCGSFGKYA